MSDSIIIIDSDQEEDSSESEEVQEDSTCHPIDISGGNDDVIEEDETTEEESENINVASDSGDLVTKGTNACTCVGCSDINKPNHSTEVLETKRGISYSGKTKQYCRTIQPSWYNKYPWITVCTGGYKIFCRVCCMAKQQKLLSPSVFKTSLFIAEGFGSWNKALERFDMHKKVKCIVKL